MFSLHRKIIKQSLKKTIENIPKPNKVIENIKIKMFCDYCNGTGYQVFHDVIVVCNACSGTGIKHYTYF